MTPSAKDIDTREKLLEVGAQAFAEKSFNSCGLAEILQRAGVPKGSFYHYFASKEDFGVALIEKDDGGLPRDPAAAALRSPPHAGGAVARRLRAGPEECLAHGAARLCLIPKMRLETGQLSEPVHAAVKYAYEQWTAILARTIREAQAAGELRREDDPDRIANVLVMLWEGATIACRSTAASSPSMTSSSSCSRAS
jgi:TetR/AcrR family transcriptional repressor of nem operon